MVLIDLSWPSFAILAILFESLAPPSYQGDQNMPLFRYCPRCGHPLPEPPESDQVLSQRCLSCGAVHYRNAKPCAGALVVQDGRVLLGRRGIEPFKDWWDIPGGFLEPWEHPAEAVVREVAEETGLDIRPTGVFDIIVDTYGEGGDYTLNIFYLAEVARGSSRPGDDLVELRWFSPDELPERIAFDNGRQVLGRWKQQVRGSVMPDQVRHDRGRGATGD